MSEIKHTPLPWKMVSTPNFDNGLVYTSLQPVNVDEEEMKPLAMVGGEYHICRMSHTAAEWRFRYHRANAEFIVRACNAYYDNQGEISKLREALLTVLASLVATTSLIVRAEDEKCNPSKAVASDAMFAQMLKDYDAATIKGRAALAGGSDA